MKVVIDANIFVSAMRGGKPEAVIERVIDGLDTLFVTDEIVSEIERTLQKPKFKKPNFNMTQGQIDEIVADVEEVGQKVIITKKHKITDACRDRDDDKYLECALAAKADYIITGDKDLLVLKGHNGIKIVTANKYLEIVTSA